LIDVEVYDQIFDANNALVTVSQYDVVIDASDNPRTRYILNDACVLSRKPLISGAAIGLEGQLSVYNHNNGPCYRCAYPLPPTSAPSCSENGVVGPVPSVIGHLQAIEALKIVAGFGEVLSGTILMYDARSCSFHRFKLPPKRQSCIVCGSSPTVCTMEDSAAFCALKELRGIGHGMCGTERQDQMAHGTVSKYVNVGSSVKARRSKDFPETSNAKETYLSCSTVEYNVFKSTLKHILLDVRDKTQFGMCRLNNATNIPVRP
jgi:adenylyltransferase and sulfurtransferase